MLVRIRENWGVWGSFFSHSDTLQRGVFCFSARFRDGETALAIWQNTLPVSVVKLGGFCDFRNSE